MACPAFADSQVTVNIYNGLQNKGLWLYLQYAQNNQAVNVSNVLPNAQYVQPWKSGSLPVTEPLKFTFTNIDGAKLFFGLMGTFNDAAAHEQRGAADQQRCLFRIH